MKKKTEIHLCRKCIHSLSVILSEDKEDPEEPSVRDPHLTYCSFFHTKFGINGAVMPIEGKVTSCNRYEQHT